MRILNQLFFLCTTSQIIGGDFAKFCGLLRIYDLYENKAFDIKPPGNYHVCAHKLTPYHKVRFLNSFSVSASALLEGNWALEQSTDEYD